MRLKARKAAMFLQLSGVSLDVSQHDLLLGIGEQPCKSGVYPGMFPGLSWLSIALIVPVISSVIDLHKKKAAKWLSLAAFKRGLGGAGGI